MTSWMNSGATTDLSKNTAVAFQKGPGPKQIQMCCISFLIFCCRHIQQGKELLTGADSKLLKCYSIYEASPPHPTYSVDCSIGGHLHIMVLFSDISPHELAFSFISMEAKYDGYQLFLSLEN